MKQGSNENGDERLVHRAQEMTMADAKIYMLNALWFKKDGGARKYAEYAVAAGPFVAEVGGKLVESYAPELAVIGEWDPDMFFVVEYPSWDAFTKLRQSAGYLKIVHLREEALEKSLLIRCQRAKLPLGE